MKVSLNTIKQFTDVDVSVDELVAKIGAQLGGVEEVIDLGKRYTGATIVKVVSCDDHPNADRLHVCTIDDGGVTPDVKRNEQGLVQVVCGAPNVHADMFVVWLPPKSTVPATFTDKEPFVLEARELRGVTSNGMLASARELGIGDSHEGILEIDPKEWRPNDIEIKPGTNFAKAYGLDDTIIDIENKMFTHRPDLFGQLGVAREIAGIQHKKFESPKWYLDQPKFEHTEGLALEVFNDAPEKAPRFMAVAVKDIEVKPSPLWLQCALVAMGSKPINNIVDATNYVMLLTAQPTHAYDYDKLRGGKLGARLAKKGEKTTLLNGKEYELSAEDIVIADGEGIVGLGGIMGGGNSEVSNETKNIVLEVANFDMYAVRKTSMRHGLFTDALTRFNKGQSPLQTSHVMSLLLQSVFDVSPGKQASKVFDNEIHPQVDGPQGISTKFINERLGLQLSRSEAMELLKNVEVAAYDDASKADDDFHYNAPFWRTDIELPEDIVEEVGRLYGFDNIPRELPLRSAKPTPKNHQRVVKQRIRNSLAKSGANEVLTYSFVHENVMKRAEQDVTQAFRLSNALSPDLQYYRLSVLPSLLAKVHANVKAGYDEFTLFEIGKGHNKKYHADDDNGLPTEMEFIDLVYTSKQPCDGAAFYYVRRQLVALMNDLHLGEPVFKSIARTLDFPVTAPFDQDRSALVETADGTFLGMIGELKQPVIANFKLPAYTAAATLDLSGFITADQNVVPGYQALSKYPSTTQDICFQIATDVRYGQLAASVRSALATSEYQWRLQPIDIYHKEGAKTKNITFRIRIVSHERTLQTEMINALLDSVTQRVHTELDATRL